MKKTVLLAALILLGGCSSFGRGVAEAILDKNNQKDTRQCEIKGSTFKGIEDAFKDKKTVKVLMIHGVGTHVAGYSTRMRENLAKSLGLNVFSTRAKNITLINPKDGKSEIGNLRVMRMQNEEASKDLIFYELTWSSITTPHKEILNYDVSGEYQHKRAVFNNSMKAFLDDTVPDPMIYLMDKDELILNAMKQSTCWMLGRNWEQIKNDQKAICKISSYQQITDLNHENIIFITHSLGSRILLDSIVDIVEEIGRAEGNTSPDAEKIIDALKNKEMSVFMMANQLPLLQISRRKPQVRGQIPSYCTRKGKNYDKRVFKRINIVAFSDPNDLLSYDIPQSYVDEYIDSRMCPRVTNVSLNVAEIISAFGVGVVNPVTAHTEYDNDERVIELMSHGMTTYKSNPILKERCDFIRLKN